MQGSTPLLYACGMGDVEIVRLLLKAGADVDEVSGEDVSTHRYFSSKLLSLYLCDIHVSNMLQILSQTLVHFMPIPQSNEYYCA
jgi:ankyrin repeat protein